MSLAGNTPRRSPLGLLRSWFEHPNPVLLRELRQAARLRRTPVILAVATILVSLLVTSVGGIASLNVEPASVGVGLFHTFFSIAFAVVAWVGPAVAAVTIASERSQRTWEALLLTGLGAQRITAGKFLSALSYVLLYVVILAPVGTLPFLFGGVGASEVLWAFALLIAGACLSVAFGLAISSPLRSPAMAIVVTLLASIPASLAIYGFLGIGLSFAAHELWEVVPQGLPVWLPTAYARAPLGWDYLVALVVVPLASFALPGTLLYRLTVANLTSLADDRSSGIRRWFLRALPAVSVISLLPATLVHDDQWPVVCFAIGVTGLLLLLSSFLFAGEPLGPSRRVRARWQRDGVSRFTRYLGPGVLQAMSLLMGWGVLVIAFQVGVGSLLETADGDTDGGLSVSRIFCVGAYACGFTLFLGGFSAWVRSRCRGPLAPRLWLLGALFLSTVGPWLVVATGSLVVDKAAEDLLALASPSPSYVFVMLEALDGPTLSEAEETIVYLGLACAAFWGLLGPALYGLARRRVLKLVRLHQAQLAELEAALDDSPGGARGTASSPPGDTSPIESSVEGAGP